MVALLAGTAVWFFAFRGTAETAGGQTTPAAAASALFSAVGNNDLLGAAAQLDPVEAHLFADMTGDILTELKRLGVVKADVKPDSVTGVTITTKDLAYAAAPQQINDHISIVNLTGGTITATFSGSLPFSDKINEAFPDLKDSVHPSTSTVDIANEVAKLGHPIRIATVKRDGKWYPSLFYTIADNWAYSEKGGDYTLSPIAPRGSATPQDAMNTFLDMATTGSAAGVIATLSPDEMGVLQDYGSLIIGQVGTSTDLGNAKITKAEWDVTDVTGGKKVSIKDLEVTSGGDVYAVVRDPASGSLRLTLPGQGTVNINPADPDNFQSWIDQTGGSDLDPQVIDIITREFPKIIGLGVVMVQAGDGQWYVSPIRTYSDVMTSLLSGLQPADVDYLISLAKK